MADSRVETTTSSIVSAALDVAGGVPVIDVFLLPFISRLPNTEQSGSDFLPAHRTTGSLCVIS